jgi:hypothetical protein
LVNVFEELMSIIEELYSRTVGGKHGRTKMAAGSGSLFCNCKHFFSVLLLPLADATYCFIEVDVRAVGKSSDSTVSKKSKHREETGIESTGNPREQMVA